MTSIDCGEYVDMGEHNKPLCKKSGYRPAECELCPTRVASLEAENAKLRELVRDMNKAAHMLCEAWEGSCSKEFEGMSLHEVCPIGDTSELCVFGRLDERMRDLEIEVKA